MTWGEAGRGRNDKGESQRSDIRDNDPLHQPFNNNSNQEPNFPRDIVVQYTVPISLCFICRGSK